MFSFMIILLLAATAITLNEAGGGHEGGHDHVIIHVPYHIKTIKHTHTITKHIHHKDNGADDKYEILGYTYGHPIDLTGIIDDHGGAWPENIVGYNLGNEMGGAHERY